ncbi:MAG: COG4223 family protein [Acidiphilium sp.]
MNEPEPPIDPIIDTAPAGALPERTPIRRSMRPLAAILILAVILLAAGEAWLYRAALHHAHDGSRIASLETEIAALRSKVAGLDGKVTSLASRPVPKPVAAPPQVPDALKSEVATLQASVASLSTTTLADHADLATLRQNAADLPKLAARAQALVRIAEASLALQNGEKLGALPNAPEALVRYEDAPPPTLGALKADFPAYASRAERAGGDVATSGGFWQRVKGRIENLVTIRRNTTVLVGSRASGMLGAAQAKLDRDDLAGALATLKPLPAPAAAVMAPWETQARRLLGARAALAAMAEGR